MLDGLHYQQADWRKHEKGWCKHQPFPDGADFNLHRKMLAKANSSSRSSRINRNPCRARIAPRFFVLRALAKRASPVGRTGNRESGTVTEVTIRYP